MSYNDRISAAVAAGVAKAKELGSPSSIAVLCAGRNLVAFQRMEGALLASIEISQGKAYTAASLRLNSGDVTQAVQPGGPFYGMEHTQRQPMVVFAGGLYVAKDSFTGAVGVAGGTLEQDVAVAEAVAAAL
ncbi:GlcG/HbpS family heme-binding protein [Pseudogemmobacter humi]|uniref:Heme-binding protein n=1 Tax=Pseudogemmobacter humi TaxID=2483812 RepID=A0A3P5WTR0_9RHOB|nr:heme-binding protein [Pseudogemmobacter humi]VDC22681.1 hypothetical protein XINFAN_00850 [Pseudogemmobacter humi]